MRADITSPTLTSASAGANTPLWFLQIDWSYAVRLCSYGTTTWNGYSWTGGAFQISGFDEVGKPTQLTLVDFDAAYRTLVLNQGLRDKRVRLWLGFSNALATADPILIFDGFADGVQIAGGKLSMGLDWVTNAREFSPRERIGPAIGVNFVAAPGTKIVWGGQTLVLEAR